MSTLINNFEIKDDDLSLYSVDNYVVPAGVKSMEQTGYNSIILKNISDNPNTNNFYGDGRHGDLIIRGSTTIQPHSFYFEEYQDHPIFGHILYNVFWSTPKSKFELGEYILYVKHTQEPDQVESGELGRWCFVDIVEVIRDGSMMHYRLRTAPSIPLDQTTANAGSMVYQFRRLELQQNVILTCQPLPESTVIDVCASSISLKSYPSINDNGWLDRAFSDPVGPLVIKSQTGVLLAEGAAIRSMFGHAGTTNNASNSRWTSAVTHTAAGPLGAYNTTSVPVTSPNFKDIWSSGTYSESHYGKAISPGSPGNYGGLYNLHKFGRPFPIISDLNRNMFLGFGGTARNYGYYSGYAGGGFLLIQSPKLTMKAGSYLNVLGTDTNTAYPYEIRSGAGSILLKCNELELDKTGLLNTNTIASANKQMFKISLTTDTNTFAPGLIQIEFENLVVKDATTSQAYTPTTFASSSDIQLIISTYRDIPYMNQKVISTPANFNTGGTPWQYQGNFITRNFSDISPIYNTGKFYKATSNPLKTINIKSWFALNQIMTNAIVPDGTDIRFLFSTDNATTWKAIDFAANPPALITSGITDAELTSKGNTLTQMNYISSANLTRLFIDSQATETAPTLDILIALKTTKQTVTPEFFYTKFDVDLFERLSPPIPMKPFNKEEFASDNVKFVWLQPEQPRGSIQNRIEISETSDFSTMSSLIDSTSQVSSVGGNVVIPFKPPMLSNRVANLSNFKLPYMKVRSILPTFSGEENLPSTSIDTATQQVVVAGGDIYFYKGTEITLPQQYVPIPQSNFKFNNTHPLWNQLYSYIDFTNVANSSSIVDQKYTWAVKNIPNGLQRRASYAHGSVGFFNNTDAAKCHLVTPINTTNTNPMVNMHKPFAMFLRFSITNPPPSVSDILTQYIDGTTTVIRKVQLYQFVEPITNITMHGIRVYSTTSYFDRLFPLININEENILVLRSDGTNFEYWLNGRKVIHGVETKPVESTFANVSTRFAFFQSQTATSTLQGSLIEFGTFSRDITEAEILSFSNVPQFDLRYNPSNNTYQFHRRPYLLHLTGYDRFFDNYYPPIGESHQYNSQTTTLNTLSDPRSYGSTNHSIRLGTLNPLLSIDSCWKPADQSHNPIPGVGFLSMYPSIHAWNSNIYYDDNNSIRTHLSSVSEPTTLTKHGRYNPHEESVRFDFLFQPWDGTDQTIEFNTGRITETARGSSRRFIIRLWGSVSPTPEETTNGYSTFSNAPKWKLIYNSTTELVGGVSNYFDFPAPLEYGKSYSIRMYNNGMRGNTQIWIYSESDSRYSSGYMLFDFSTISNTGYGWAAQTLSTSAGKESRDVANNIMTEYYEDAWFGVSTNTTQPAFLPISIAYYNNTTTVIEPVGHLSKYSITQKIDHAYLRKVNRVYVDATLESVATSIKLFVSFDKGQTFKKWAGTGWITVDSNDPNNGMTPNDIIALGPKEYAHSSGLGMSGIMVKTVLYTTNPTVTPKIKKIDISYNGPYVYDSWDDVGSNYDPTVKFYYNSGTFNPFVDPDFSTWVEMGSDPPDYSTITPDNGSPGSKSNLKVYAGASIDCVPRGLYYWRVAAYNGL